ncbi:hypothetical protein KQX54_006531 [Cotesia glomerata]|uniref:Uncharacterized protein n=1 Tax=Cotesia glomerata TaxID=32391 RepID=A0AAV7I5Y9_COTGL|nr:hypothetical protein KQX54_006531 [Cotesia glomerata]
MKIEPGQIVASEVKAHCSMRICSSDLLAEEECQDKIFKHAMKGLKELGGSRGERERVCRESTASERELEDKGTWGEVFGDPERTL